MNFISYIRQGPSPFFQELSFDRTKPSAQAPDAASNISSDSPDHRTHYQDFWKDKKVKSLLLGGLGASLATASAVAAGLVIAAAVLTISAATGILPIVIGVAIVVTLVALTALGIAGTVIGFKRASQAKEQLAILSEPEKFEKLQQIMTNKKAIDHALNQPAKHLEPLHQAKELMIKKLHYDLIIEFKEEKKKGEKSQEIETIEAFHLAYLKLKKTDPNQAEKDLYAFINATEIPNILDTEYKQFYQKNILNRNVTDNYKTQKRTINHLCNQLSNTIQTTIATSKTAAELDFAAKLIGLKTRPNYEVKPLPMEIDVMVLANVTSFDPTAYTNLFKLGADFKAILVSSYKAAIYNTA